MKSKLALAGFTNLGYLKHAREFVEAGADMTGKTVLITGATGGLGLATTRALAGMGARTILVGRSRDRLVAARATVDGEAAMHEANLSLMSEVGRLAERILETEERLDVLINNVGVLLPKREMTAEGLEKTLATNLSGHFLLTNLLVPLLADSSPSRIVNVSSGGMYSERIVPEDLHFENGEYSGTAAYARTKRGQVILTEMWAAKLTRSGIAVHSMHPGWAKTAGVRRSLPTFNMVMKPFLRTPEQGADTIVWLASADDPARSTGRFWFDRSPAPTHMMESTKESSEDREALWSALVEITGCDLPALVEKQSSL